MPRGHECTRHSHNGPGDYRPDGSCIHCSRERQAKHRNRSSAALRVFNAILTEQPIPPDAAEKLLNT